MKMILEIKGDPRKDDVIIWNGKEWEVCTKDYFLFNQNQKIAEIENKVNELYYKCDTLTEKVNQKLKEYHDVLKIISKGE